MLPVARTYPLARIAEAYRVDPRVKRPWMLIHALGSVFSFEPDGNKYRSGEWIVSTLVDVVSKGGVFEVGIGPDAHGLFHPIAVQQLEYAGDWLKVNGEAIYGTRPWTKYGEGPYADGPQPAWRSRCRGFTTSRPPRSKIPTSVRTWPASWARSPTSAPCAAATT